MQFQWGTAWKKRSLLSWNYMIQRSTRDGLFERSLVLYSQMVRDGCHGDSFTLPCIAKACGKLGCINDGRKIHAHIVLTGFGRNVFVQTALADMYSKCSALWASRQVFDEMPVRALVSWNSMISSYSKALQLDESFGILKEMRLLGLQANSSTLVSLVSAALEASQGLSIHGYAIKLGFASDLVLLNSIMNMYVKFDLITSAHTLFNLIKEKSIVSWTTLISGYIKFGNIATALILLDQMRQALINPDSVTFAILISACSRLGGLSLASCLHAMTIKSGWDQRDIIENSLISVYGKCGDPISAQKIFYTNAEKNVFSCTSMIGSYFQNGYLNEALSLFWDMLMANVKPNKVTIMTVILACADLGSLSMGKMIEEYARVNGFMSELEIQTSLIHMLCKCGELEHAKEVFDGVVGKDIAVWSSMIYGCAIHGEAEAAFSLFENMLKGGTTPDAIVFTGLLLACSHSGLVKDGLKYFSSMQSDFGLNPGIEHYSCLIDLLGRAGNLDLAFKVIQEMPILTEPEVWTPLLGACKAHLDTELGEYVAEQLLELGARSSGCYILMSNIYASLGRWEDTTRVRKLMIDRGFSKLPGFSRIEVNGVSHVFIAGDQSHHHSVEIYETSEQFYRICCLFGLEDEWHTTW